MIAAQETCAVRRSKRMLRGKSVRVAAAEGVRDGIAEGVDSRGALRVRHGDTITLYDSAEVTVRAR